MASQQQLVRFREFGKKIIGFGRTYSDHAKELNNPIPKEPVVFLKPTTAYIAEGTAIQIPKHATELHHEVELGIVIGKAGKDIPESSAMEHVGGYCLILDMTDRVGQAAAAKAGLSWSLAKGFDTSCPVSELIPLEKISDPQNVDLWLKVNGVEKQKGNTKDMIFTVPYLISWISQYFTLEVGDLLLTGTPSGVSPVRNGMKGLTGTPSGVSPVRNGDVIECGLGRGGQELKNMKFNVKGN